MNRPTLIFPTRQSCRPAFHPPSQARPIHPTRRRLIAPCLTESAGGRAKRSDVDSWQGKPFTCTQTDDGQSALCDIKHHIFDPRMGQTRSHSRRR